MKATFEVPCEDLGDRKESFIRVYMQTYGSTRAFATKEWNRYVRLVVRRINREGPDTNQYYGC